MENKKIVIAIIVVIVLIVALIGTTYFFGGKDSEQLNLLTEESNKLLQADLATEEIDLNIKTEKSYATVERAIKEYILKLKNIYVEMEEMVAGINPNNILSAQNVSDKDLEEIETIVNDYKTKSQNLISEYETLIAEDKIKENIDSKHFSSKKSYYIDLYNTVMLSDVMKSQYEVLEEKVRSKRDELYDKLNIIDNIKKYLEDNENYWTIKDNKIQFTNLNKMTEYYNLLNQMD